MKILQTIAIASTAFIWQILPARSQAIPNLTNVQANQFARDLTFSPSQDFFARGKIEFERYVRRLQDRRGLPEETLLRVNGIPIDEIPPGEVIIEEEPDVMPPNSIP